MSSSRPRRKLPLLQPLAPTQSKLPYLSTQLIVMAAFVAMHALCILDDLGVTPVGSAA